MTLQFDAVDLFAGPGGWDIAAEDLGLRVAGIEWDKAACDTRRAAGLVTIEADVRAYSPGDFLAVQAAVRGLIGSPPCPTFSSAGKGSGRQDLPQLLELVKRMGAREAIDLSGIDDERTALVLEPLRWALAAIDLGAPFEWIALEQVPPVLPVWEAYADVLRAEGYTVETAVLRAEQYGVPQTRRRAILIARLGQPVAMPAPTHSRYWERTPDRLDEGVERWVSMAEALGWGMTARPYPVIASSRTTGGPDKEKVGGSGARRAIYAERDAGRWVQRSNYSQGSSDGRTAAERGRTERELSLPSVTVSSKGFQWRPAPTLVTTRRSRDGIVVGRQLPPGESVAVGGQGWDGESTSNTGGDGVRVSEEEAAALQSFPVGYPWQGSKTERFQQIGNAVPPVLARAVLQAVALGVAA